MKIPMNTKISERFDIMLKVLQESGEQFEDDPEARKPEKVYRGTAITRTSRSLYGSSSAMVVDS
jgi:hypothetical protein